MSTIDPSSIRLTIGGEELRTTAEHPFFVLGRGWVEVEDLQIGDQVRRIDGSYAPVEALVVVQRAQRMDNLTVAEAHTFFVGDAQ